MTAMDIIQAKIAERQSQGLCLIVQSPEGSVHTLYPKDKATKAQWIAGYTKKGWTICAS